MVFPALLFREVDYEEMRARHVLGAQPSAYKTPVSMRRSRPPSENEAREQTVFAETSQQDSLEMSELLSLAACSWGAQEEAPPGPRLL